MKKREQIGGPKDIYERFKGQLDKLEQEHFYTVYLDTKNQIISEKTHLYRYLKSISYPPREIFRHAVKVSANSVIFVHNHPSGDASPSQGGL